MARLNIKTTRSSNLANEMKSLRVCLYSFLCLIWRRFNLMLKFQFQEKWEPKLNALIKDISNTFSEAFDRKLFIVRFINS